MKTLRAALMLLAFFAFTVPAMAQQAGVPNGKWKWAIDVPNAKPVPQTLVLKVDGANLSGYLLTADKRRLPISDGKFEAGVVTFKIVVDRGDTKFSTEYTGEFSGNKIVGQMASPIRGEMRTAPWEASRG